MFVKAEDLLADVQPKMGGTEIKDPATGETVGRAPEHDATDLDSAVAAARAAQPAWAGLGHTERSAFLTRAAQAVEDNAEALAELLSREQGKPLNGPNARFEVGACAAWLRTTASFELEPEVVADGAELHYRPRCRGSDRAVELAHDDQRVAAGPVAAHGEHGGAQAVGVHAALGARPRARAQHSAARRCAARGLGWA